MRIRDWLKIGIRVKRWLTFGVFGILLIAFGFTELVTHRVYDIYYKLSVKYGIEITIEKFCNFTGIDYNTINSMGAKPGGFKLRQKILSDSEQMLASQLTDRRINPIGTLAKLNRWHNWKETASGETSVNITLSESPAALADRYRAKIADKKAGLLSDSLTDSDAKQGL